MGKEIYRHPYRECPYCGAHLDAGEVCDCGGQRLQGIHRRYFRMEGKIRHGI